MCNLVTPLNQALYGGEMNLVGSIIGGFFGGAANAAMGTFGGQNTANKTSNTYQSTPRMNTNCQHNGKDGVSPGDIADHVSNAEIGLALNDAGVDIGQTTNDICDALGREVLTHGYNESP